MHIDLKRSLTLPCGAIIENRLCKSAMSECLADRNNLPTKHHFNLYAKWAASEAGLMITGNVAVDCNHLEKVGNVLIDGEPSPTGIKALKDWAEVGKSRGKHFWMQLNHAGRQTPFVVNTNPDSSSDVQSKNMPGDRFGKPISMNEEKIYEVIRKFSYAADIAKLTGFTGVQIHAAHGYLISQFLSPDINLRGDMWGGCLKNRATLLIQCIREIKKTVGKNFPVSVKLNVSDFQKGGFSTDDFEELSLLLNSEPLDLLELSGGAFEQNTFAGNNDISLNMARVERRDVNEMIEDAYFVEYARRIRNKLKYPLLVTGGFRKVASIDLSLSNQYCDLIGLSRPMCIDPLIIKKVLKREVDSITGEETIFNHFALKKFLFEKVKILARLKELSEQAWFYLKICGLANNSTGAIPRTILRILLRSYRLQNKMIVSYKKNKSQRID